MKLFTKKKGIEQLVICMFSLLPFIDMLNGLIRNLQIGSIYKILLCLILFYRLMQGQNKVSKYGFMIFIFVCGYILLSITINIMLFNGKIIDLDYPIKLIFNLALFLLLIDNCKHYKIEKNSLFIILDVSSWIMIACYLIPYVLGVGNRVYANDLGYKGFFIAQNELNVLVVVFTFFVSYKLINKFTMIDFVKMVLLLLCGMLLNTKTTIIACIMAVIIWLISILRKKSFKTKIISITFFLVSIYLLKDQVLTSIYGSLMRYNTLQSKYYGGSFITSILSGRDYYIRDAWSDLNSNFTVIRTIIGNGFCSNILIEMDILDIFFYLGIIGAFFAIVLLIWIFKESYKNCKKDRTIIRIASYITLVILIFLAGHVLFMAMSGCYFIIYCSFLIYYRIE